MVEAVPVPRQLWIIQEHHEVRQDRIAVDAAAADLAHQIHAHRVTAEREERAMAERKNAAIAPDQVDRERQDRVADIFSEQRYQVSRHLKHRARRQQQIGQRQQHADRGDDDQEHRRAAIQRAREDMRHHASTARPFSANRPRGRFWMNRMIRTRMAILPSTAPATGSRNLLAMPSVKAPTSVPQRLPTPPNTTTMKESMI